MKARETFEQWLIIRSSVAGESTIEGYRFNLIDLWREMGNQPISALTQAKLAAWIKKRLVENRDNPNTLRKRLDVLATFMRWCRDEGHTTLDPIKGLPAVAPAETCKTPFSWGEYQICMDACRAFEAHAKTYRIKPTWAHRKGRIPGIGRQPRFIEWPHACILAWHTGLRFSDCALLKWEQCDFISDVLRVQPHKMTYTRQNIVVPMEPGLRVHLLNLTQNGSEYVCPDWASDYHTHRTDMLITFRRLLDNAGLPRHSFHSYRHAFVSRLLNAGVDSQIISQITGQTPETIAQYAHISIDAKREAMSRARHSAEQTPKLQVI